MRHLRPSLILFSVAFTLGVGGTARANPFDKLSDEDLAPYRTQAGSEAPYRAGERLLADLAARDKYAAASLEDAAIVRYHDHEAKRFANDKQAVIYAYGVLWVIVTGFAVFLWLRQRRINAELIELSAKIARGT